jgi:GT2 family glycosyltransferase
MTIDVVIAFYRQHLWAPFVAQGLLQNKAEINHVYIVNDEPWGTDVPPAFVGLPTEWATLLDHEHKGFGLCASLNQGATASQADYLLFCEGDEILPPYALAHNKTGLHKRRLLCAPKAYIAIPSPTALASATWVPEFLHEPDHRFRTQAEMERSGDRWALCSGGHLLVPREAHEIIGGFDEQFEYGLHDYDYAARWMTHFGRIETVVFMPNLTPILHIGTGKGRAQPAGTSKARFRATLQKLRHT